MPDLHYSWYGESILRAYIDVFTPIEAVKMTDFGYEAAAVIKYREIYLTKGEAAADASPLISPPWWPGMDIHIEKAEILNKDFMI